MTYDAIVVGASFAGLSAAMQLARARKQILVVDAGQPRNRFAAAAHGFLGQDGVKPAAIMREGLRQLSAYPTVDFVQGLAISARGELDAFDIELEDGFSAVSRRLVLATGVRDELPETPGLAERWGASVLHCPYCHGYEIAGGPLGVIANGSHAALKALLISDWGPVTLFTQGEPDLDPKMALRLQARGVTIEPVPIAELIGEAPTLSAARLVDGRIAQLSAVFVAPRTHMASPLAAQLGCEFEDGPSGPYLKLDQWKQTTVPGVYAGGDAAAAMHNATLASASGVLAGVGAHQSLLP